MTQKLLQGGYINTEVINAGKIANIETFHLSIPAQYGGPKPLGDGQWPFLEMLVVRIETDTGLIGWGEAFGHKACATTKLALETLVIPHCIGADAGDIGGLNSKLHKALHVYGLGGVVSYALSGIDIAMWDIRGQAFDLSLYKLLGGENKKISAYASLLRYGDPDLVGLAAADAVARGHGQVKLHEASLEAVKAARAAVGPNIGLMLDVNCRWSHEQSLQMANDLIQFDLKWIEEPCWPPKAETYRLMAQQSGAKIAAGENAASIDDLAVLCMSGAIVYLQPSAALVGWQIFVVDTQSERGIMIKEERGDVIIVDHKQHIDFFALDPITNLGKTLKNRCPRGIVLFLCVFCKADGR